MVDDENEWIVLGENKGKINLVSKSDVPALLPKGSFLTIESDSDHDNKFILRVDNSQQNEPYQPSPMLADMDLELLDPDRSCQNAVAAFRIDETNPRDDGLVDYIKPQSKARRSTQDEVEEAVGENDGPPLFLSSVYSGENRLLRDNQNNFLTARMPEEAYYHQMMICGKTGSGKTVASKYLAQYFVEEMEGAVLALNVKDDDFLKMDQPSHIENSGIKEEWGLLGENERGIKGFRVYRPANTEIRSNDVNQDKVEEITLDVAEIEPESLTGLLKNVTDVAAMQLPDIFRYWKEEEFEDIKESDATFSDFIDYFRQAEDDDRNFDAVNAQGHNRNVKMHHGTYQSVLRSLGHASSFFDNEEASSLDAEDILQEGKFSVINVTGSKGTQFGSIMLRDLLDDIVDAKVSDNEEEFPPILIIIDEVHQFYDKDSSEKALEDLSRICRKGRSQKMGVIFSSQNPADIPNGLSSVINSKIFFRTDAKEARSLGVDLRKEELQNLDKGYSAATIHGISEVNLFKFPLAYAGVFERDN